MSGKYVEHVFLGNFCRKFLCAKAGRKRRQKSEREREGGRATVRLSAVMFYISSYYSQHYCQLGQRQKVTWIGNKKEQALPLAAHQRIACSPALPCPGLLPGQVKLWNAITIGNISAKPPTVPLQKSTPTRPIVIWKPNYRCCPWAMILVRMWRGCGCGVVWRFCL